MHQKRLVVVTLSSSLLNFPGELQPRWKAWFNIWNSQSVSTNSSSSAFLPWVLKGKKENCPLYEKRPPACLPSLAVLGAVWSNGTIESMKIPTADGAEEGPRSALHLGNTRSRWGAQTHLTITETYYVQGLRQGLRRQWQEESPHRMANTKMLFIWKKKKKQFRNSFQFKRCSFIFKASLHGLI